MTNPTAARPRIAAIAPWVGQPSNVWMHRQFAGLSDQLKTVVTWEYVNRDQFPLPDTDVRMVPPQFAEQITGWPRKLDTLIRPHTGAWRFGAGFNNWLKQQFIECGAEAVIGQFGNYAMLAEDVCRSISIPVFAHFHGFDISGQLRKKRYRRSLQRHWHPFAGMVVVANYQRDYLLELGYDSDSIALVPCGAPTKQIAEQTEAIRAQSAASRSHPDDACCFLFVGRYVEKKDPLSILRAFQKCYQACPHARLRMAGFGPLEDECREWISRQPDGLSEAIEMQGTLSPDRVIEELAAADVFIQHSRVSSTGDKEGWPVVIAEAMAASLPIVATRHAGIVDQVIEGQNGFLCDEGDWQQMSADMIRVANDAQLRDRFGRQSLASAHEVDASLQIERLREFINHRVEVVKHSVTRRRAA